MDAKSALLAFKQHGQHIELRGHRIFVSDYGKGPPVLFLHGFPTSSFDYVHLVPHLAAHRRLIFFDFLGFGCSDKPRAHAYSLIEQAAIAEELVQRLGLLDTEPARSQGIELVAHDMGSSVALILLARARVKVAKLVLLNGSVLLKYYRPLLSQRLLLNRVVGPVISALRLIRRPVFARQFRRLFPKPPPEDEIDAFYSLITSHDGLRIYHRLIGYLRERAMHEDEWFAALAAHPAPLLVLWGQRDPVSRPRIAEAIVEAREAARHAVRYVPLPALGHYPQWEDPETVAREMLSFLTAATPAAPPPETG